MTDPHIVVSQTPRRPAGYCPKCGKNEWTPLVGRPFEECANCAERGDHIERYRLRGLGRHGEPLSP